MPFLSIVTRHMVRRPALFATHVASLQGQTDQDFEHVLIVDEVGRGIGWSHKQFAPNADRVQGDYVLILDDDDMFAEPTAVAELKAITAAGARYGVGPDLVIFQGDHGEPPNGYGILPDVGTWGIKPQRGRIGSFAFIARRELWQACTPAFTDRYDGDFDFLEALWNRAQSVTWLPRVLVKVQRISRGARD